MAHDSRPIGLFDSGVGGLTVLRSLAADFPDESFVYLGDTARLPYGTKGPQTIARYLRQNVAFLLSQDVKLIIVACNSASTVLLDNQFPCPVPVYNVIEPGAQAAVRASVNGRIGVLGTRATVQSESYLRAINKLKPQAVVFQQAAPLLVPLVEEGWLQDPITNLVIHRYLAPLLSERIDTLVLGCTHYPALHESFQRIAGSGVALVESSASLAEKLRQDLASEVWRPGESPASLRLFATDTAANFVEQSRRLLGVSYLPKIELVDLALSH